MKDQTLGMLCFGAIIFVTGYLMTTKEKVAAWGLRQRSGKFWVKLLGPERALKLTRYVFGPLVCSVGALLLLGAFLSVR